MKISTVNLIKVVKKHTQGERKRERERRNAFQLLWIFLIVQKKRTKWKKNTFKCLVFIHGFTLNASARSKPINSNRIKMMCKLAVHFQENGVKQRNASISNEMTATDLCVTEASGHQLISLSMRSFPCCDSKSVGFFLSLHIVCAICMEWLYLRHVCTINSASKLENNTSNSKTPVIQLHRSRWIRRSRITYKKSALNDFSAIALLWLL